MKITISTREDKIEKVELACSALLEIKWVGTPLLSAQTWIEEYIAGVQPNYLPPLQDLSFPAGNGKAIILKLTEIPFGKTCSYSEFATMAGFPKAHRFIGTMIGKNPFPLFLPCHRVIRSDGSTGGFAFGSEVKAEILNFEKLIIN